MAEPGPTSIGPSQRCAVSRSHRKQPFEGANDLVDPLYRSRSNCYARSRAGAPTYQQSTARDPERSVSFLGSGHPWMASRKVVTPILQLGATYDLHRGGSPVAQTTKRNAALSKTTAERKAPSRRSGRNTFPIRTSEMMYVINSAQPCQRTGNPHPQPWGFARNQY